MTLLQTTIQRNPSRYLKILINKTLVVLLYLIASSYSFAESLDLTESSENGCEQTSRQCVEQNKLHLGLSIGIGLRTNPLYQSDNIPLVLLPRISFYSGNFFLENLDLGYTVLNSKNATLALLASPSYDSVFFNRWDPGNVFVELAASDGVSSPSISNQPSDRETLINPDELTTRKFSYLGGLEYSTEVGSGQLQLSALKDLTGTHSGSEVRFAYQHLVTNKFMATIGFTWQDQKLTNYYYGVTEREIVDDRAEYTAGASFNPFVRATYRHKLDGGDSWHASFQYQYLDKQISQSPIAVDDYVVTAFIGKTFKF